MTEKDGIAQRDVELLSAYLDGELDPAQAKKLEARLATEKQLSGTLEALQATAAALRSLPEVRPPRSFALTEEMVRPSRGYPLLQFSTALAALGFVLVVGVDLIISSAGRAISEQASFAADRVTELEQPLAGALAPAETPTSEELAIAEAEIASTLPAAAPAEGVESYEDFFRSGEATAGEELPDGELAELDAQAEEDALVEGAAKVEPPLKPPTDEMIVPDDLHEERPSIGLIRVIEIGMGTILIVLVGLTLWVRRRG